MFTSLAFPGKFDVLQNICLRESLLEKKKTYSKIAVIGVKHLKKGVRDFVLIFREFPQIHKYFVWGENVSRKLGYCESIFHIIGWFTD